MAINFPHPATPDQTHSHNGKTWKWNGTSWNMQSSFTTGGGVNAGGGNVAVGTIALWSGSVSNIPAGWQLCDGTNGSPDLRDKFVIGAGNSYNVGVTGGSKDAVVVEHDHDINDSGHTHRPLSSSNNSTTVMSVEVALDGTTEKYCAAIGSGATVNNASNTTEEDTGISIQNEGSTGVNANLPPYYSLCYIYCNTSGGVPVPSYTDSDVDSHLNQNDPTDGYVLSWNGTDYEWVEQSGGISGINIKDDQGGTGGNPLDLGNATGLLFNGNGVTASGTGDEKTITIPGGIQVQNDGTNLTTTCFQLNFTGDGVTASRTDATKEINIPGYDNNDVDAHLNKSSAGNNEVLSWNGTDYDWITVSGGGDKIQENDTSVECIDDGTGDRIEFKTAGTEAVQIDANRQILISGTQSGNNVAKIYNDTDGLGTGVLGIYASSNNATPRDVRFYSGGGTANETLRIGKSGEIGVGGDVGTSGKVLTSGGAGAAATWEDAGGDTYSLAALLSPGVELQVNGAGVPANRIFFDGINGITVTRTNTNPHTLEFDGGSAGMATANVKSFGAKGDDSTDDTAAIQNAINSLVGSTVGKGGIVYLPPGIYRISSALTFGSTANAITLKGSSTHFPIMNTGGSIIRVTNTSGINAIQITNSSSVSITNLGIDHVSSSSGTGIKATSTTSKQGVTIDQVYILDHSKGIELNGYANSIIRNSEIRDQPDNANSTHAILLKKGSDARQDQLRMENVIVEGLVGGSTRHQYSKGLLVEDWTNSLWIKDCCFLRNKYGIYFDQSMGGETADAAAFHRIENCDVDQNDSDGIFIDGGYSIWVQNCYLSSNINSGLVTGENFKGTMWINSPDCRGNNMFGMAFNVNHNKIQINSPHIADNGSAQPAQSAGIQVLDGANDISIMGGYIGGNVFGQHVNSGNQQIGIRFVGSSHNRININGVDVTHNIAGGIEWQLAGQNTSASGMNFIQNCAGYSTGQQTFP